MTGYISSVEGAFEKDGLFRTTDGGKSWTLLSFGYDDRIYDIFVDTKGNAWMGGYTGAIYYSGDYGLNWEKRKSPFKRYSNMKSIHMIDGENGVIAGPSDRIYITKNNWTLCTLS